MDLGQADWDSGPKMRDQDSFRGSLATTKRTGPFGRSRRCAAMIIHSPPAPRQTEILAPPRSPPPPPGSARRVCVGSPSHAASQCHRRSPDCVRSPWLLCPSARMTEDLPFPRRQIRQRVVTLLLLALLTPLYSFRQDAGQLFCNHRVALNDLL